MTEVFDPEKREFNIVEAEECELREQTLHRFGR